MDSETDRVFWSNERVYRLSYALLIGVALSLILSLFSSNSTEGILHGGDFPGFYVLGEILNRGEQLSLYNPELQRTIENEIWPSFNGKFYMSVYPPYVALLMYPFTFVGPTIGQALYILLMLYCLYRSTLLLCERNESLASLKFPTFVFILMFYPIFASIFGAQNTALSMFIILLSLRYPSLSVLLLYKPQFGVLWCTYILFAFYNKKLLFKMVVGSLILYLMGVSVQGWMWPITWVQTASSFGEENFRANLCNLVSLQSILWWMGNYFTLNWSYISVFGYLLSLSIFLILISGSRGLSSVALAKEERSPYRMSILMPFIAPQTLFYDLGISLIGHIAKFKLTDRNITLALTVLALSWIISLANGFVYFPVFVTLIPILSLALRLG